MVSDESKTQYLGGDKGEIARIGPGLGASEAPNEEADSVLGVAGHAESVDGAGGDDGLLEAACAGLAIERGRFERMALK